MEIKKECNELEGVVEMIDSDEFRKHIIIPMEKYKDSLRNAYDCDTVEQLKEMKGKHDANEEFFRVLRSIKEELIIRKQELDRLDEQG